jgi:hypothetical protein
MRRAENAGWRAQVSFTTNASGEHADRKHAGKNVGIAYYVTFGEKEDATENG